MSPIAIRTDASETGGWSLGDLLAVDGDSEQEAAEARCVLGPALRRLSAADRQVLRLRFVEERTQKEIGAMLGLTQTQVSRRIERIVRDLRRLVGQPVEHAA